MPSEPRRPWTLAPLLAALFVLFALGCASRSYGGSGSGGYYDDGLAGGYAEQAASPDYGYAEDSPTEAVASERIVVAEKKAKFKSKDLASREEARNAAPAPTSTTAPGGAAEPEPAPEPPEADAEPVPSHGRQIIYTAGVGLTVFDVDDVMARLEAIPERHGGWLQQRYDTSVILRVPAAKLEPIIAEVSEWGVVDYKTLAALDVTAEYTDLDSRIRVLERMQSHLQELLARADNVELALEIQMQLAQVTSELEQLRAQMRMLESSIAFSTLAVTLRERGPVEVEPGDDPFPWVDSLGAEATAYR